MFLKNLALFVTPFSLFSFSISQLRVTTDKHQVDSTIVNEKDCIDDPIAIQYLNNAVNNPEIYNDYNYAPIYFKNLTANFGRNADGSCGYVAMGMLLSFWDTYWDDNIIDVSLESQKTLISDGRIRDEVSSPGIIREPDYVTDLDDDEYYDFVCNNADTYFQCLLINIGDIIYSHGSHNYGLQYSQYDDILEFYIGGYRNYPSNSYSIISTDSNVRETAINLIQSGIPVKLGISNNNGGHAVVAYDYDEVEDEIYCHFGWGGNSTHVTIESMGYHNYNNLIAIDFNHFECSHVHSNNYYYVDGENVTHYVCPCSLTIPTEISVVDKLYLDQPPTFKWNAFIGKWFLNQGIYYEFAILSNNDYIIYQSANHVYTNFFEVEMDDYLDVLIYSGNSFKILITIDSLLNNYWDDYSCVETFIKPDIYKHKTQVKPNEWGYNNRYYFSNEGIKYSTITKDDLTISTARLRCGYIEDSYVVLSPRRSGAGSAYFEMNFNIPVYSFLYSVCLWSNNEGLDGSAILQTKDVNGVWTTQVNLLADIVLRSKSSGLDRYVIQCSNGIYGVRFQTTATATGDRNKGRLCIDDMVFSVTTGSSNNLYPYTTYHKTTY